MVKERNKKASVVIIIIAFILGFVTGYFIKDSTKIQDIYQFESGDNILINSGFEEEIEGNPGYWYKAMMPAENLSLTWDNEVIYNGNRSVSINNTHIYDEIVCNNWAQTINIVPTDRIVELSGWIKTIDAESVVMVIQCWDKNNVMTGFGSTQYTTDINGTNDWQEYSTSVRVPKNTENIIVRLTLTGTGQTWFDDVTLVVK